MTLTEFLLARIAEDEDLARAAGGAPWVAMETTNWVMVDPAAIREEKWRFGNQGYVASADTHAHAAHIIQHDPARVLAECEAKRRVIDAAWGDHLRIEGEWGMCRSQSELEAANDYPEVVVALALPYVDHPDFHEEWRA